MMPSTTINRRLFTYYATSTRAPTIDNTADNNITTIANSVIVKRKRKGGGRREREVPVSANPGITTITISVVECSIADVVVVVVHPQKIRANVYCFFEFVNSLLLYGL